MENAHQKSTARSTIPEKKERPVIVYGWHGAMPDVEAIPAWAPCVRILGVPGGPNLGHETSVRG